jgi:ABC-2 type transport system permease protein
MQRAVAIARNDFGMLMQESVSLTVMVIMPLAVMAFVKPTYAVVLRDQGYHFANGSEQAVPGISLMFVFFMVTYGGLAFFREYVWSTWDRIRSLPVRRGEVIIGKMVPTYCFVGLQQGFLYVAGYWIFGLRVRGSVLAVIGVDWAFATWLMAFIMVVVAYCKTFHQVLTVSNLGGVVFAGIGGALTPIASLPHWAQKIAPFTPDYWAMRGFNHGILDAHTPGGAWLPVCVLLAATLACTALAAWRFRFDEPREGLLPGM